MMSLIKKWLFSKIYPKSTNMTECYIAQPWNSPQHPTDIKTALKTTTALSSGNDKQRDTLIGTWNKPCNFAGRPSLEPRSSRFRRSRSIYHQPTSASSRSLGFLTMTALAAKSLEWDLIEVCKALFLPRSRCSLYQKPRHKSLAEFTRIGSLIWFGMGEGLRIVK